MGDAPTHPELLDDLAAGFVANAWSLKWLHRQIVLSAAYRQSSRTDTESSLANAQRDPKNRLLWRMNVQQLAEGSLRDAILAASGMIDLQTGGPSVAFDDLGKYRRSLYFAVPRTEVSDTTYNASPNNASSDSSAESSKPIVATAGWQSVSVSWEPLIEASSLALAERLTSKLATDEPRVDDAYVLMFCRQPTEAESEAAIAFVRNVNVDPPAAAWQQYCQVLFFSTKFRTIE